MEGEILPMIRNLEIRLRKLEGSRRTAGGEFFLAWGESEADCDLLLAEVRSTGAVVPGDTAVMACWTGMNGTPPSRWIGQGDLDAAEMDALCAAIECKFAEASASAALMDGADQRLRNLSDARLLAMALGRPVAGLVH